LGGERHSSKCVGKGRRKGAKGQQGRYHATNKIEGLILRFVGLGYLLFCIRQGGHYPRTGAQINNDKSHNTGFPFEVFLAVIYLEIPCAMCMVYFFLRCIVLLNNSFVHFFNKFALFGINCQCWVKEN
jgi:hypothetical protein